MDYIDEEYVKNIFRKRDSAAHKGDFGKVLIFAGSTGMAGAAVLCGRAALQSGAGLVQFLLPAPSDPIYPVLQETVPEATCVFYKPDMDFSPYTSVAAGSGLGKSEERLNILADIIWRYGNEGRKTLVLDADALNLIAGSSLAESVIESKAEIIITPHIGEAKRLLHTGRQIKDACGRRQAAMALAEKYNCIAVLKGEGTLVCEKKASDKTLTKLFGFNEPLEDLKQEHFRIFQNTTGNPGMATAGSGDALTGMIASLAGQGYSSFEAACLGVYFHGLAGDMAADEISRMGMTAGDIARFIPYSFAKFEHSS